MQAQSNYKANYKRLQGDDGHDVTCDDMRYQLIFKLLDPTDHSPNLPLSTLGALWPLLLAEVSIGIHFFSATAFKLCEEHQRT